MNKAAGFIDSIVDRFANFAVKIEQKKVISAIRNGLVMLMPAFLIGAAALIVLNLPIPAFTEFIKGNGENPGVLNGFVKNFLLFLHGGTFGIVAFLILLAVSYSYAKELRPDKPYMHLLSVICAASAFVASFDIYDEGIFANFGVKATVYALITAIAATGLFILLAEKFQHINRRQYTSGVDANFSIALSSVVPFFLVTGIFALANLLAGLIPVAQVGNVNELIIYVFSLPFKNIGSNYGSNLLYVFLLSFLWFFGVHGGNALHNVATDFGDTGVAGKSTLDVFVSMGGGGAIICLLIAVLLFSRSRTDKRLAVSAAPSVIFNISEVFMFGLPVVFNVVLLIPFILVPIVFLSTTHAAMALGLVPETLASVNWTTPVLFNGFSAADSLAGSILQLFNLALGVLIYWPFVKLSDRVRVQKKELIISEMTRILTEDEKKGVSSSFTGRRDYIGATAKTIAADLRRAVSAGGVEMHYQPQTDGAGNLVGGEALLRWKYDGKYLYPPLVLKLAQEDGFYGELSAYIMKRVCEDTRKISDALPEKNLVISANIQSGELKRSFIESIIASLKENKVPFKNFCLEITETEILADTAESMEIIDLLLSKKIILAIDDFSMGSTSIKYLQNNKFDYVKLDGAIVRNLASNPRNADIISSITALGENLNFEVVAEYVESKELMDKLKNLGCKVFQGWYFSPAIPAEEFILYARSRGGI